MIDATVNNFYQIRFPNRLLTVILNSYKADTIELKTVIHSKGGEFDAENSMLSYTKRLAEGQEPQIDITFDIHDSCYCVY